VRVARGGRRAWRWAPVFAVATSVAALAVPVAGAGAAPDTARNPSSNTYPNPPFFDDCSGATYDDSSGCVNATVQAIDNARAGEGLGSMALPTNWYQLTPTEQLYVATNLERTVRGLAPLSGMATQLDQASAQAAEQGQDPTPPSNFPSSRWGGNWAGGSGNPLENIYFWMYYDGANSNNVDCQKAGDSGCWVHRDNILLPLECQPCVMGTGFAPNGWHDGTSWAELLADTSGNPPLDYSWSQVVPYLPNGGEAGPAPAPAAASAAAPNRTTTNSSPPPSGNGQRMVEANGGVFDFGSDAYDGSVPGLGINVRNIIGLAPTADDRGYWVVGSDGGIFAFGDAPYDGSVPGAGTQVDDIVGFAATADGGGYWMAGTDGGIFAFGDAGYHGSVPGLGHQVDDIVGLAPTADGGGYWLVGRNGEVWAFGDAPFLGSPAASRTSVSNLVGMAVTPGGAGYWLVGSDGGVFSYGNARYYGSVPASGLSVHNVIAVARSVTGAGYWLFGSDGGVFAFGDAPYLGSLPGLGIHVQDVRSGSGI